MNLLLLTKKKYKLNNIHNRVTTIERDIKLLRTVKELCKMRHILLFFIFIVLPEYQKCQVDTSTLLSLVWIFLLSHFSLQTIIQTVHCRQRHVITITRCVIRFSQSPVSYRFSLINLFEVVRCTILFL